jgi:WhiB family redox-sensing transcriptional regulator
MTTQEAQLTWAAKRAHIANSIEANERHRRRRQPPIIDWDKAITNLLDFLDGTYLAAPPPLFRRRMSGNDYSGAVQRCLSANRIGARDESPVPRLRETAAGLAKGEPGRPISLPSLVIESLPDLAGAACAGRSDLFDLKAGSLRHRTALAMCAHCRVLAACRAWFESLPAAQRPVGVVAGFVHGPANEKCTPTRRPAGRPKMTQQND